MNDKKVILESGKAGMVLTAALLVALTGCAGYVSGPQAGIYVAPPVVEVAAPADYVYYPGYNVYFNSSINQYAYLDGGVWVSRPSFPGVSVDVLLASPSVRMDFHDSPANHSAEMARQYPRNWAPPGGRQVANAPMQRGEAQRAGVQRPEAQKAQAKKAPAPKANQKSEKREEHGEK